jgi:glycoside hydrolase-like protein
VAIRRASTRVACILLCCLVVGASVTTLVRDTASADPVTVAVGPQGFDACIRPPLTAMQAWKSASPYRAYGIYIGGVNQRCSPGGSNAYIAALHKQGWDVIPIYVGFQAPCVTQPGLARFPTDPFAAWDQGVRDANDAINQFANAWQLGAPPGVIYVDLEPFSDMTGPCSVAVINYLGAWTTVLHNRGLKSGVYGSAATTIRLMYRYVSQRTSFRVPDDIWIASWGPCGQGPN